MNMTVLWLQVSMVIATMALFATGLVLNEWVFATLEFARGVNWIYLPAGVRLLATLLFAEAGGLGLLLISWWVCFFYFFPNDFGRSFAGGILAALAPYLVYRIARHQFGLQTSLANLSSKRLLVLILAYSVASPLLHHVWFAIQGQADLMQSFLVMFLGDLSGTLIVIYAVKALLSMIPRSAPGAR